MILSRRQRALFQTHCLVHSFVVAVLAQQGEQTLGIALGAPLFSTMGGGTVLNESDRSAVSPATVARQWHAI